MYPESPEISNPPIPKVSTDKSSIWIMLVLIFLLPLFFIPTVSVPLFLSKTILVSLLVLVGLLVWVFRTYKNGVITFPRNWALLGVLLVPMVYLISSLTSPLRSLSLFGYNVEVGTFGSVAVLFLLSGIVSLTFKTKNEIFRAMTALLLSFFLIAIFAILKLLSGGSLLVWDNFSGVMGNPIGSWTDYAIFFGLIALLSAVALEYLPIKRPARFYLYVSLILSTVLLAIINFSIAWALLLGSSILLFISSFLDSRRKAPGARFQDKRIIFNSKYSLGLVLVSLLFLLNPTISSRGSLANTVSSVFKVENTEVRPSFGATWDIIKADLQKSALLGAGPNSFAREWVQNKPEVINASAFWNVAFPFGVGFLPTQIASTGVLGTIAWAIFLIPLIFLGVRGLLRREYNDNTDRFLAISLILGTLFLMVGSVVYVPSITILTLMFIFAGLLLSASVLVNLTPAKTINFGENSRKNILVMIVLLLLVLGGIFLGFKIFQKSAAAIYFQRALIGANEGEGKIDEVEQILLKAINFSPDDVYYRALSGLYFNKARIIINSSPNPTEAIAQSFQTTLSQSITAAQKSIEINPLSYDNWIGLGGIYEALVAPPLNVGGAYEEAKKSYEEAKKVNPQSPEIELLLSRLELAKGDIKEARAHINEAIRLKNDYAAGYFLKARMEIQENNLPDAIAAAEAGAVLSPGNAGVYFELGLLKYSVKDFQGAAQAFIAALQVVPNYANAQYFLGLSLYELKMLPDAIVQFEALEKTNPDNQEVKTILSNLKAGRSPFYPSSTNGGPATRANPPLESAPAR